MNETKEWYLSKGIWGAVVTLIATGLALSGYNIGPADQAVLSDAILGVVGAVGGLLALYGRVTAAKKIK